MGNAVVLTQEQADFISHDLAELIDKVSKFEETFDHRQLRVEVREAVQNAIREGSIYESLERDNLELEENLRELRQVRKHYLNCKNSSEIRLVITALAGVVIGSIITGLLFHFF